jgi:hypothetical protein
MFARILACAFIGLMTVGTFAAPAPDGFVLIKGGTFNMGSPANEDYIAVVVLFAVAVHYVAKLTK